MADEDAYIIPQICRASSLALNVRSKSEVKFYRCCHTRSCTDKCKRSDKLLEPAAYEQVLFLSIALLNSNTSTLVGGVS